MIERHGAEIMVTEREAQSYDHCQQQIRQCIGRHDVFDLLNACCEVSRWLPPRKEMKQTNSEKGDNCQHNKFRLEWPVYWKSKVVSWKEQEEQADGDWGMK